MNKTTKVLLVTLSIALISGCSTTSNSNTVDEVEIGRYKCGDYSPGYTGFTTGYDGYGDYDDGYGPSFWNPRHYFYTGYEHAYNTHSYTVPIKRTQRVCRVN